MPPGGPSRLPGTELQPAVEAVDAVADDEHGQHAASLRSPPSRPINKGTAASASSRVVATVRRAICAATAWVWARSWAPRPLATYFEAALPVAVGQQQRQQQRSRDGRGHDADGIPARQVPSGT